MSNISENEKKRIHELVELINKYSYYYYSLDSQLISDKEWDALYYELLDLEAKTGYILDNSPSKRVGGDVLDGFEKVTHEVNLYSLDKAQSIDEIISWHNKNEKIHKFEESYSLEYKFDGLSISLTYDGGKLVLAATRGNGTVGENVTAQVKTIRTVPLSVSDKSHFVVQGEVIMRKSELEKYNAKAEEKLKNPRNAAAGGLRNLDPKVTKSRNLDFFAYNVAGESRDKFKTQKDINNFLREQGFLVEKYFKVVHSIGEIKEEINSVDKIKRDLDYDIDGMVIKLNNLKDRAELGFTLKSPRGAVAYKFEAEEVSTILHDITWQVGRTGKITPVAELEPTELAGATIKRATLNNYDDILRKKIKIGSRVLIRRSNEVIPEVLGTLEYHDSDIDVVPPRVCPCCGTDTIIDKANIFCPNHKACKKQILERLTHFARRDAMNIETLSRKTLEFLMENFQISSFSDLYKFDYSKLIGLTGFGEKKVNNIIESLENSKDVKLSNFLYALGIDNVGVKLSKELAKRYKTLENFRNVTLDDLISMNDVGELTAEDIFMYLNDKYYSDEIDKLIESGIKVNSQGEKSSIQSAFSGGKFVLTGTLASMGRNEASAKIEELGGEMSSSVSKNTTAVIVGENPGSKYDKAQALGIRVIFEEEFLKMLEI